ncbi:MAG: prepilin-type N-terminal cleavage/methylation domain-containing protein [Candidatus Pacebacteria bacterium]|nr:prepilin-type N-terminal cleavage/methylation domain-containing protein [Candidatus Paceibacterota bacterium]
MKQDNQKSFTLLELLVVIAIIAILAGVVIASVVDLRQRAKESKGMQFSQNIRTTLSNELVGEWTFDEEANPGKDSSEEGNNGTVNGATWTEDGKVRGALDFDGTDDYVDCGNKDSLNIKDQTLSAWIYVKDNKVASHSRIIDRGGANYNTIRLSNGKLYARFDNETTISHKRASTVINEDQWHYVVATYDDSIKTTKLFIDGNEPSYGIDITGSGTKTMYTSNQIIGGGSIYPLFGFIDEVRIYKRALTAKQIKHLYAESLLRHISSK